MIRVTTPMYRPKILEGEFLNREVPCIKNLAAAAASGDLSLFSSEIVRFEVFGAPGTSLPQTPGHDFEQCAVVFLKSGFDFSIVYAGGASSAKDQLEAVFRNYPDRELQSLVLEVGPKRLLDAVHLITAERHQMDFMLTTDRDLVEAYRRSSHILNVSPVFPTELLRSVPKTA